MALFGFGKKSEGGLMDAIRCDEKDFLIWKWRPAGQAANSTRKENAIRTGSSISVRPGQAAVFLYQQKEGEYDVIKGPYNGTIKTENLPILSSIIGAAYAGGTPFQAEVYYFNLAKGVQIPFTIPYFNVVPAEPEYRRYDIQVAIKGSVVFEAPTQKEYIKYLFEAWSGNDTTLQELESKIKSLVTQEIKQIVSNAAKDTGIFVLHFNSLIGEMGKYILARIQNKIMNNCGVIATDITIDDIRYDEDTAGYRALQNEVANNAAFNVEKSREALLHQENINAAIEVDGAIRNETVQRMAEMQLNHQEDMMARMREEGQFAQRQQTIAAAQQADLMNRAAANRANLASDAAMHRSNLASESMYMGAHQINVQADVMKTGLNNMGDMGAMNFGGGNGNMNPAGMMASMMMGTAVAGQMGNMMNNMGSALSQQMPSQTSQQTPPPMPGMQTPPPMPGTQTVQYFINVNGQQYGPCDVNVLAQMVQSGQINAQTMAWCNGMANWSPMSTIPALMGLFQSSQNGMCPPPFPNM